MPKVQGPDLKKYMDQRMRGMQYLIVLPSANVCSIMIGINYDILSLFDYYNDPCTKLMIIVLDNT